MTDLINNLKNKSLSSSEMENLNQELNHSEISESEYPTNSNWLDDEPYVMESEEEVHQIKSVILDNLHYAINLKKKFKIRFISLAAAAAVCIAILACYVVFDFNRVNDYSVNFATAENENATVILPDSSKIKLNQNSDLTYSPLVFKKDKREIEFSGEGYFKIARDEKKPFTIKSGALTITVKGTEFNLMNNPAKCSTSLYLVEGKVDMYSSISHQSVKVRPGQLIEYSTTVGSFQIITPKSANNILSWYTHKIIFNNEPLPDVITYLEEHYNVKIKLSPHPENINGLYFYGTLPTENLPLALRTLGKVYGLKITTTE